MSQSTEPSTITECPFLRTVHDGKSEHSLTDREGNQPRQRHHLERIEQVIDHPDRPAALPVGTLLRNSASSGYRDGDVVLALLGSREVVGRVWLVGNDQTVMVPLDCSWSPYTGTAPPSDAGIVWLADEETMVITDALEPDGLLVPLNHHERQSHAAARRWSPVLRLAQSA